MSPAKKKIHAAPRQNRGAAKHHKRPTILAGSAAVLLGISRCPVVPLFFALLSANSLHAQMLQPGGNFNGQNLSGDNFSGQNGTSASFVSANLSSVNFTDTLLGGASLNGANLTGATMTGTILTGADLRNANAAQSITAVQLLAAASVTGVNLSGNSLSGFNLNGINLTGASLPNTILTNAVLTNGTFTNVNFNSATMSGVTAGGSIFNGASFVSANLSGATLSGATFNTGTNFNSANLSNANLSGVNLSSNGNLTNANFTGASLANADLASANLNSSTLTSADLTNVNLTAGSLNSANLTGATMTGTILTGADLRNGNAAQSITAVQLLAAASVTGVNLSGNSLSGFNLNGINLTGASLPNTILTNAVLTNGTFTNVNFNSATMSGVTAGGSIFNGASFVSANLSGATLSGATFNTGTNFNSANLSNANLSGVNLSSNGNLTNANFTGASLANADLASANLNSSTLTSADLTNVNLTAGSLNSANLTGATMTGTILTGADLRNANAAQSITAVQLLAAASVTGVNLSGNSLSGFNLNGINLTGASLPNTILTNAVLTNGTFTNVNFNSATMSGVTAGGSIFNGASFVSANLSGATLSGATFNTGTNFNSANLSNANLSGVNLSSNGNLTNANFTGASLANADLASANLNSSTLTSADLTNVNLTAGSLNSANLTGATMTGTILTGADLRNGNAAQSITAAQLLAAASVTGVNLGGNSLSGFNLNTINLTGASLPNTILTNAVLTNGTFTNVNFNSATMSGVTAGGSIFNGASFVSANLSGATLSGATFNTGTNFNSANLSNANLSGVNLSSNGNLTNANFTGASLANADLASANLNSSTLTSADLTNVNLTAGSLNSANLTGATMTGTILTGADLRNANAAQSITAVQLLAAASVTGVNLSGNSLSGFNLNGINLTGASLPNTTLTNAVLTNGTFTNVNFNSATMSGVTAGGSIFNGASFVSANLSGATLSGATFNTGTNFNSANLSNANLSGVNLSSNGNLTNANFTNTNLAFANLTGANVSGSTFVNTNLNYTLLPSAMPALPVISGATVIVTAPLSVGSPVSVNSGGTLAGNGNLSGNVTVLSGGNLSPGSNLSPGASSPGTFTVSNLILNAGANSNFKLGQSGVTGGANNDLVNVTGNLTIGGNLNIAPQPGFTVGSYTLYTYNGSLTNNGFSIITGLPVGDTGTIVTGGAGQVDLTVSGNPTTQFWDGTARTATGSIQGGSGTWDNSTTNWTTSGGTSNTMWQGATAVFMAPGGAVTLAAPISAQQLQFGSTGYTIASPSFALTLTGSLPTITVTNASDTATISAPLAGTAGLTVNGAGTLVLTGTNTYTGLTHVMSGVLQIGDGATSGASIAASSPVTVDAAGTLAVNLTNGSAFANNLTNNGVVQAITGGGSVETLSGVISGTGSFVASGHGTTILTNINTYTGATTVNGGSLLVNGSLAAASAVTVNTGGTLGGLGTINGAVTIASGGALTPGSGATPGTLTVGSLTLNTGSILNYQLAAPTGVNSLTTVKGNLALGGATLNLTGLSGFGAGTYDLINYGTLTGSALTLGTLPAGFSASNFMLNIVPNQIDLIVTATQLLHWLGTNPPQTGGNGNWDLATTNWAASAPPGATPQTWTQSGTAIFGGPTPGAVTIPNGANIVAAGLTFTVGTTAATGYNITDNAASGGTGTLTLIGAATISVSPNVFATITAAINDTNTADRLTIQGGGTLILSGANAGAYLGSSVTIAANTTVQAAPTANPFAPALPQNAGFVVNGALDLNGTTQQIASLAGTNTSAIITNKNTTAYANLTIGINSYTGEPGTSIFAGQITDSHAGGVSATTIETPNNPMPNGDLGLTLNPPPGAGYTLVFTNTTNNYSGLTVVSSGGTTNSTVLQAGAINTFSPNSVFDVGADGTLDLNGFSQTIAGLSTTAATPDTGTVTNTAAHTTAMLTIGNANLAAGVANALFSSVNIQNGAAGTGVIGLTKIGGYTQVLAGTNTYSGATVVSAGVLTAGSSTGFSPNSAYTVNGTLDLNGYYATAGSLSGSGSVTNGITGDPLPGAGAATLTTGSNNSSTTFSGVISDGVSGTLALTKTGSGVFTLTNTDTYSGATNVNAGTLQIGDGTTGGKLSNTSGVTVANNATLATNLVTGATFTPGIFLNGANAAMNGIQSGTNTLSGVISGTGILNQTGTGTTILTNINTYTGATTINNGALLVNGSLAAPSAVTVNNGGTLGGSGTINGAVTIASGGALTPGPGATPGTLTVGSLTLNSGSILNYQLAAPTGVNSLTTVKNNLTLGGATLNLTGLSGFGVGTYDLINYGTLTGNTLNIGSLPSGFSATVHPGLFPNQIDLIVTTTQLLHWLGTNPPQTGGNGIWDLTTTNWGASAPPGASPQTWTQGETAVFGGPTAGTVTLGANITAAGLSFPVGAGSYTFVVTAGNSLTINGAGITNNSNVIQSFVFSVSGSSNSGITFTNSASAGSLTQFTIQGGTIAGGNGGGAVFELTSTAGSASITNQGGTVNGAGGGSVIFVDFSSAGGATITNNSGTVDGATGGNTTFGYTSFGGVATAGGATIINQGGASVGSVGGSTNFYTTSTAGNSTITNNGGPFIGTYGATYFNDVSTAGSAMITNNGGATYFSANSSAGSATIINIGATIAGGTFSFGETGFGYSTVTGQLTTAGTATIINQGAVASNARGGLTLFATNSTAGNATVINNAGTSGGLGGETIFEANADGGTARVEVFGNGFLDIGQHNAPGVTIGSIEGTGNVFLGGNNLTVGSNNLSTTFSGVIQDGGLSFGAGGSLTKIGTGTTILTNINTYTGATTINNGALLVNGSLAAPSAVTVNNGGTLGGSGTINGAVTIASGGALTPGPGATPGTLTVGSLTLNSGSILNYQLAAPTGVNSLTTVKNNLTLGGGTLNITGLSGFGVGTYDLINYGTLTGNTLNIGSLPSGFSATVHPGLFPNQIDLIVTTTQLLHWLGTNPPQTGGNGIWDLTTTNWGASAPPGATTQTWTQSSTAIFGGPTPGAVTISNGASIVAGGLTFTAGATAATGYNITDNAASGGTGTLTLSGAATISVSPSVTATVAAVLNDTTTSDSLTIQGGGTLVLSGSNAGAYLGSSVTIAASTTVQAAATTNPFAPALPQNAGFVVNGALDLNGTTQQVASLAGTNTSAIVTNTNTTAYASLTVGANSVLSTTTFAGKITDSNAGSVSATTIETPTVANPSGTMPNGDLGLTVNPPPGAGYSLLLTNTTNNYSGLTIVSGGGTTNVAVLQAGAINTFSPNSVFVVGAGGAVDLNGFSQTIAGLSTTTAIPDTGTITNTVAGTTAILTIGNSNLPSGVANALISNANIQNGATGGSGVIGLTKIGGFTQVLAGTNTYSGATLVSAGTLTAGSATGFSPNSAYTVNATLDINGYNTTTGSLQGSGTVINGISGDPNTGPGNATLTAGSNNSSTTFSGLLQDGSSGTLALTKTGSGTFTLTNTDTYTGATNVTAGALQIGDGVTGGNLTGTTGVTVANNATLATNLVTGATFAPAIVLNGTNAAMNGIQSGTNTLSGVISGTGILNQTGTGTTILTNINTYTGATTINNGALLVNGSLAAPSAVTVNNGGTLGGSGTINGSVTISAGGALTPGSGATPGTLTVGSLTLNNGSILNYQLATPSGVNSLTVVKGNLTLGGATLNITGLSGFGIGTYDLINYTGTLTGSALTLGALPAGFTASNVSLNTPLLPNQIDLVVTTAQLLHWLGTNPPQTGGNGIWDLTTTNWGASAPPGATPQTWTQSSTAIFGGPTAGTVTLGANITAAELQFPVASGAYTITATPGNSLTISGVGITNTSGNTENFVTTVSNAGNSGTIIFSNIATAGSMTAYTNNGSAVSGASAGSTQFFNSANAGSGLFMNNPGSVSGASGGNTLFRDTSTASSGTFTNNGSAVSGASGGSTQFNDTASAGGGLFMNNPGSASGASGGFTFFGDTTSASNATLTNNGATVSGASGGSTQFNGGATAGSATLIANGGTGGGLGGQILFSGTSTGGTARVEVFGNGALDISALTAPSLTVGSIEGSGNVFLGANNLTVGSSNLSTTFSGVIQDGGQNGGAGGSLTMSGTGTLTLTGINTYTGPTTINSGALLVNGSLAAAGAVTVNGGGTLGGSGTINGAVTIAGGAALTPGPGATPGTLTVGSLTLNSGSILNYQLAAPSGINSLTNVNGNLTLGGATLNITGLSGFAAGTYDLINYTGKLSGSALTLGALPTGFSASNLMIQTSVAHQIDLIVTPPGTTYISALGPIPIANSPMTSVVINSMGTSGAVPIAATTTNINSLTQNFTTASTIDTSPGTLRVGASGGIYITSGSAALTIGMPPKIGATPKSGNLTAGGNTANAVGALLLENDSASALTINSTVINNGTGMVSVTVAGAGKTVLAGTNTYSGTTTVNGGTLQVGDGVTAGTTIAPSGPAHVNATGTLAINLTDGSTFSNAVSLNAASASLNAIQSGTNTLSGVISGSGALNQNGAGTTILTAANTYAGGTFINAGLLSFNSLANFGPGPIMLNGGGLQWAAGTTTDLSSRLGTINAGGANFDTNGNNLTFASPLSGAGGLTKSGAGSLTLTAANLFTGNTVVSQGALYVDGSTASANTTVQPGAMIGGFGAIGGSLNNGGSVSPGDAPGTLTIPGNYTQSPTGTLLIRIGGLGAGQHDLLAIGGSASLGGTLQIAPLNGFRFSGLGQSVTFLTAAGGVSGTFATVINPLSSGSVFGAEVLYSANSVSVESVRNSFVTTAKTTRVGTPNQLSVAQALDASSSDPRNAKLVSFLGQQSPANLLRDLDLIAPPEITSVYQVAFSQAQVQLSNLDRRLEDVRFGSNGFSATRFSMIDNFQGYSGPPGDAGPLEAPDANGNRSMVMAPTPNNRWGVFATGSGEWANVGDTDIARGYDLTDAGITLGVDYKATDHFAIGLGLGYDHTSVDLAENGRVVVDSAKLALYGTYFTEKGFYTDFVIQGGYDTYDSHRTALEGDARSTTDGGQLNVLFGTGYDFKSGALTFGPTANFKYIYSSFDSFSEQGSLAPLQFPSQHQESITTAFGAKASYDLKIAGVRVRPELRARWQHEYSDNTLSLDSAFANGAGPDFTVHGPAIGRDSMLVGAGFAILWSDRFSTNLYYDGELFRMNYHASNITGGCRLEF